ncbi:alpha/beta hydrolase [Sinobaca sp. H24]|uniref:alpha/beta hydrolase n=1 Tax=Sinobaca sp. H24 TaxID=2923376 RepID=UPI00207AEA91|nr:alpha/beta hydrolase fold domain-containing protein [Sinobaca sp. H24]
MNNKDMDDPYCRYLANHARTVVVNVNYSKAPETPFPGALEECYQVMQWLRRNGSALGIDTRKIAGEAKAPAAILLQHYACC